MNLDSQFLTVHPLTALWWHQRSTCQSCAHVIMIQGQEGETVYRCSQGTIKAPGHVIASLKRQDTKGFHAYCIDMRQKGACGPRADFFQPKD